MKQLFIIVAIFTVFTATAQTAEEDVLKVKSRLDSIEGFSATIKLHADISFIQMPDKEAAAVFTKGEPIVITSEDFTLIPKRGLDLSFRELFEHPFITVDRGEISNKANLRAVSILPTSEKADFSLATLHIDTKNLRIVWAEINTKKDGTYALKLVYPDNKAVLPSNLTISFEIEKIRIPLNFAGKDVKVDRKKMREEDEKKGRIILDLDYSRIGKGG
ncbi:hypothetical protein K8089_10860 [Aequorivita sp. F47161]|uniref:Outer membrane lipoprotein carrier protein LolA n=1 Tax=Aequorivita vitellina TaxID=2874475 RepID=A0A9X1U158_9FLAO|nr:hypothetical protein [Aequorivita vitellina]MCG2419524.1 hypothetical protein [Aequorivita vitellina]